MIPFKNTPWGKPIIAQEIAPGVWVVATASHGGFYLNTDALARIPDAHQAYAARWSHGHGPNWFEEAVAACAVIVAFPELIVACPELFDAESVEDARAIVRCYIDREISQ